MVIGRSFTIFITLIIVCLVKSQYRFSQKPYVRNSVIPDGQRPVNIFIFKPTAEVTRTTSTMRPLNVTIFPQILYDYIFNFSNVGLKKIGPDFITSDKVISINLGNNEISNISPYAFRGMRKLKYLNLSGNRIPTKQLLSFVNVDELQILIIDNNNPISSEEMENNINNSYEIENYEDNIIFKKLERLHICNSQLKKFLIRYSTMPILTYLYLSNNSIVSSDIVFNNIPNTLRNLFLDNNLIDQVEKNKFRYLRQLNMDNNIITEVCYEHCMEKSISLKGANNMEILSLSRNNISKITVDAFKDTKMLLSLDLSGNNITEVSNGIFNNTVLMKHLFLADNKLGTIPKEICSLKYLISLNLTGNHIIAIHANDFCDMPYLRNLYLANNNINTIGNQAFIYLRALKYLDLSGNQLQKLPQQWVHKHLEELHLENNYFEQLDDAALDHIELKNVYLDENPMINLKVASIRSLSTHLIFYIKNMHIKDTKYDDNKSDDDDNDKSYDY